MGHNPTLADTVIVVTGLSKTGKTTLCKHLVAARPDLRHVRLGLLLRSALTDSGIEVGPKIQIGPVFLKTFGLERYMAIVRAEAEPGSILDGIRIPSALKEIRRRFPDSLHVHLWQSMRGPAGFAAADPYAPELHEMAQLADLHLSTHCVKGLTDRGRTALCELLEQLAISRPKRLMWLTTHPDTEPSEA